MHRNALGRFVIESRVIEELPGLARQILAGLIVVRAEQMFHRNGIEYVAIGPDFLPVARGEEVPRYDVIVKDLVGGTHHVQFIRSDI